MSSFSPPTSTTSSNLCVVCGDRHHGHHFGVLACRACSSFWRRSLVERKVYKCRNSNNCDIGKEGMKNACRACRLKRCKEAGMKGEIPSASINIQDPISQYQSPYTAEKQDSLFPLEYKANLTSELSRYQVNYRNFCSAQRSLFIVENPKAIFSTPEFKKLKRLEHERMERGSIALLHTMCNECSETYRALPKQTKLNVIKNFSFQFAYLNRCYMSANYYPEVTDPRICIHFGYYMTKDSLGEFFEDIPDIEKHIEFVNPLMDITIASINRFREVQLREIEVVALMAISFYNIMSDLDLITPQLNTVLDSVNNELLYDVISHYGIANAGVRIGRLHSLLHHVAVRSSEMKESMVVARIFLIDMTPDVWVDLDLPDDQS